MSTHWLVTAACLMTGLLGCNQGRFPTCKTDAECAGKQLEGVKTGYCFDLRCVECRHDDDCAPGNSCNTSNECHPLGGMGAPVKEESWDAGPPPPEPEPPTPSASPSASAHAGPAGSAKAKPPKKH